MSKADEARASTMGCEQARRGGSKHDEARASTTRREQARRGASKDDEAKKKAIRLGIALESTGVVLGGDKQENDNY
jgi:hypothetical protein